MVRERESSDESISPHKLAGLNSSDMLVIASLQNPKYRWRTKEGVQSETHLSDEDLTGALSRLAERKLLAVRDGVIRDRGGEVKHVTLMTTPGHWRSTAPVSKKILSSFSGTYE